MVMVCVRVVGLRVPSSCCCFYGRLIALAHSARSFALALVDPPFQSVPLLPRPNPRTEGKDEPQARARTSRGMRQYAPLNVTWLCICSSCCSRRGEAPARLPTRERRLVRHHRRRLWSVGGRSSGRRGHGSCTGMVCFFVCNCLLRLSRLLFVVVVTSHA